MDERFRAPAMILAASLVLALLAGGALFANINDNQVRGCERSTLDRWENASGWRTAATARRAAYRRDGQRADLQAARRYEVIAASLESRTRPTAAERTRYCHDAHPLLG